MSKAINPYHYYDRLLLWLDGADPFGNENASTPANNSSLATWHDKSLNRNNFTASSGNEPTYDATNKKVVFDGSEHMSCNISDFPDRFSMIVVASITITDNSQTNVIISGVTSGNGDFTFVAERDENADGTPDDISGVFTYKKTVDFSNQTATTPADVGSGLVGIFEVLGGISTASFVDVNNVNNYTGSNANEASFLPETVLNLMKNIAGNETTGFIQEIIMLDNILSPQDRMGIQGYLKHKYSLPDYVLSAGADTGGVAFPSHQFLTKAPKVNDVVITHQGNNTTAKLPDIFLGMHKVSPRSPFTFIRLSLDENVDNSNATYGDKFESRGGIKQYYFSQEQGYNMSRLVPTHFPCLVSVTPAPVEIVPTKGVSLRGNISIKLRDFVSGDDTVSFLSKFIAQNPFYVGRKIEIFEGFLKSGDFNQATSDQLQFFDGRREYIIDSMHLNKGILDIKAKDPLQLAGDLKSKVPVASRFATNTVLNSTEKFSDGGGAGVINMQFDGTTQNTGTITNTSFADFESTYGANGATGHARINEEIVTYEVVKTGSVGGSPVIQLKITARGQWGTTTDAHEAGDSVQQCVVIGDYTNASAGSTIDVVAYDLLVNRAGVSARAIETTAGQAYSWTDEKDNWLSPFKINAILSEPKAVNTVLAGLARSVGTNFFWNDNAGKILMKADTPLLNQINLPEITDDDILLNTFNLFNSEKERISRVFYYYGQKNSVEDKDKAKNFKNLYVNIDSDSESSDQYGVESNKIIYGWGVKDTSTATSISQRMLSRFKTTPISCEFVVDKSNDEINVGDHFYLSTKHILDVTGDIKEKIEMQCLSLTYNSKNQTNKIKAKSFIFLGSRLAKFTNPIFNPTPNAGGSGYSASGFGDFVPFVSSTGSATTASAELLTFNSGAVTSFRTVDSGFNHTVGDVITFGAIATSGAGSGFKAIVQQATFNNATSDAKLTGAFVSADSVIGDINSGANSRSFLEITLVAGGSGYSPTNGTATFTQASGHIQGATRGTQLVIECTISSGVITAITSINNPSTGSEVGATGSAKGFLAEVELNLDANSGTGGKIKVRPSAKMTDGTEAYTIT